MCGICGVIAFDPPVPVNERIVERMRDSMTHRGPDDEGLYLDGPVALGHRRLSIIDRSGGHQPMANGSETLWVTYNGEIYNHREIRATLEAKGYHFRTKSDTEVILHAYAEYGLACVEHFRGMFAFGLWDVRQRMLLLARDRLGIKPLYYTVSAGALLFASEIKALLQWPGVPREIEPDALRAYLQYRYVPGPLTMFRGIFKLQPGHTLTLLDGRYDVARYWDVPAGDPASARDVEREFRKRLEESVRLRLMSEVPLGVFLSGGLDSSAVVGLMTSMVTEPVQTFSVGYPEGDGDADSELSYARLAAKHFGSDHHDLELDPATFWESLPRLIWHFDEPVADPAAIPLYFLAKRARESVTVVLSGEGADELLAGYSIYHRMLLMEGWRQLPGAALVARMAHPFASRAGRRYLKRLTQPLREHYRGVSTLFSDVETDRLLTPRVATSAALQALDEEYFADCGNRDVLSQMLYFDLKVWLPDDLLVKADKMTMASSVELRVPFLDHKLVEWAWRLPSDLKLRGATGKYLLREAVKDLVPSQVLARPKRGFPVPVRTWFQKRLGKAARELLLDNRGGLGGLLDHRSLESILARHESGREDLGGEIFALVVLALWHQLFIATSCVSAAPPSAL